MDATNLKLLQLLHSDARTTLREMGEAVDLSINAVRERVARMETLGIIRGYQAVLHPLSASQALIFAERTGRGVDVEAVLRSHPQVRAAYSGPGRYPLIIHFVYHASMLHASTVDEILRGTGYETRRIEPGYRADIPPSSANPFAVDQLDDVDQEILRLLRLDGRATIRKLADAVGQPETTVRDRMRRLEKNQFLLGTRAMVNARALGFTQQAWVLADVPAHHRDAAAVAIMKHRNVLNVLCSATDMSRLAIHAVSSPYEPLMDVTQQAQLDYDLKVAMFLPVEQVIRANPLDVLPGLQKEKGQQAAASDDLPAKVSG